MCKIKVTQMIKIVHTHHHRKYITMEKGIPIWRDTNFIMVLLSIFISYVIGDIQIGPMSRIARVWHQNFGVPKSGYILAHVRHVEKTSHDLWTCVLSKRV